MYPIGIRVVKVSAAGVKDAQYIGKTGTVVGAPSRKAIHPTCDMAVKFDYPHLNKPAGDIWSVRSVTWRPLDPDAENWLSEEQKELEEV